MTVATKTIREYKCGTCGKIVANNTDVFIEYTSDFATHQNRVLQKIICHTKVCDCDAPKTMWLLFFDDSPYVVRTDSKYSIFHQLLEMEGK